MSDSFKTPETVAYQAWSGLPFPSPGDLVDPGTEAVFPALVGRFFTTELPGKPKTNIYVNYTSMNK